AGRPPRLAPKKGRDYQVTFSDEQLAELGVQGMGTDHSGTRLPGSLLNRLNPLRNLDEAGRKAFAQKYRNLAPSMDTPQLRVTVMDAQGIETTMNYLDIGLESNLGHDLEALYANQHAANRCYAETWGYNYQGRIITPPFISCADPALALEELDY